MSTNKLATLAVTIGTAFVGAVRAGAAATLHVPGDFATIQACIDAAVSDVDECVVAPGTYHETINFLGKAITVRSSGGRDVTTIDATGLNGSVVTCASGEGPDTVLDGFTITGGTGTDVGGSTYGGGMHNDHSSPTIADCIFIRNSAWYGAGGGMYNNGGSPTVTNCTFSLNGATTGNGGGMYNYYSSATVVNCVFSGNMTTSAGGGMLNDHSAAAVANCTFTGNNAYAGGGISNIGGSPTVTNCRFNTNVAADGNGGGMFNFDSSPTVIDCAFVENKATFGGGMYNHTAFSTGIHSSSFTK